MNVLFINHNVARRGGTFYRAFHVGRHLAARGHSVTLLTISASRRWRFDREESQRVEIVHTPDLMWGVGRTGWDPWDTFRRMTYLNGRRWDIVHAWDCRPAVILPALLARHQSRSMNGKLVIDWCDWWGRGGTQAERPGRAAKLLYAPVETFFEEAFRTRANASTVISQALFRRAVALGVDPKTIRVVRQGCDVEASRPGDGDRARARDCLALPAHAPLLIFVGALTTSEAQLLFDTLRLLFRRRSDCRFVMIGDHRCAIPPDLRSSPQFVETGFVSEAVLDAYTLACDAALVPLADTLASRARWPSKANRFLAAGRCLVMTRVGDLAELLEREQAAQVTSCDPVDIVEGVCQVLDDSGLRQRCEDGARRVAETSLAWPAIAEQLESLYVGVRAGDLSGP